MKVLLILQIIWLFAVFSLEAADTLRLRQGEDNTLNSVSTGTLYLLAEDVELRSSAPDTNFDGGTGGAGGTGGGDAQLRITPDDPDEPGTESHVLLKFADPFVDLPPGAFITSAYLGLTFDELPLPVPPIEVFPVAPGVGWAESTATWNNFGSFGDGVLPGVDTLPPIALLEPCPGLHFIDITPVVVEWEAGLLPNNGLAILPPFPDPLGIDLFSIHHDVGGLGLRPQLLINFLLPPPSPDLSPDNLPLILPGDVENVLELPAAPGSIIGLEVSGDLQEFTLCGFFEEVLPPPPVIGPEDPNFFFIDQRAPWFDSRYYRTNPEVPFAWLEWMETFPVLPLPGEDVFAHPYFAWLPFPGPIEHYELLIYPTGLQDGNLPLPLPDPILTIPGIKDPFFLWGPDPLLLPEPILLPDQFFAWSVVAVLPDGNRVKGNPMLINGGSGKRNRVVIDDAPIPPGAAAAAPDPDPVEEALRARFKALEKLLANFDALENELASNPLVQESDLIVRLAAIKENFEAAKDLLVKLLKNEPVDLSDAETALKVVCFFDDVLDVLLKYDLKVQGGKNRVTKAQRQALEDFKSDLEDLKAQIKAAVDGGQAIDDLVQELKDEIAAIQNGFDAGQTPLEVLLARIEERLQEFIQAKVAAALADAEGLLLKRFPPLDALLSIYDDIKNVSSALTNVVDLQTLSIQVNDLLLGAINNTVPVDHYMDATGDSRLELAFALPPDWNQNCQVKIEIAKFCFKAKAGGAVNEGDWEESNVPIQEPGANPDGTLTLGPGALLIGPNPDRGGATWAETSDLAVDPDDMQCPAGQGPCLVAVRLFFLNCPQTNAEDTKRPWVLAGVIKCP